MIICTSENRLDQIVGLKLQLLSLYEHLPNVPIYLSFPNAPKEFISWLKRVPTVVTSWDEIIWKNQPSLILEGWDVKVHLLLHLLNEGHPDIWWIDSDILVTKNFKDVFPNLSEKNLLVCEEAIYGQYEDNGKRTIAWNLPLGNRPPFCYNTGVIRLTQAHKSLLEKWATLLASKEYLEAKKNKLHRPAHLYGDQDVLTALLGSKEFEDIPLKIIRRGEGIIQYFGFPAYTTQERLGNLIHGMPPFIHSQRWKPWIPLKQPTSAFKINEQLENLYIELSPYRKLAKKYKNYLDDSTDWMDHLSFNAKIFDILGFNSPPLTGLPLAIMIDIVRFTKSLFSKNQNL